MRQRCVQDRVTHISETVYSMLEHPQKAAVAMCAIREVSVAEMIVYCRPPTEFLLSELNNHLAKEHDDPAKFARVMETAPLLIKVYDTVMHLVSAYAGVRMLRHDRTDPFSLNHIVKIAERKFK